MFLNNTDEDINDYELNNIIMPHHNKVKLFFEEYIYPEAIAFYIASGYYGSQLYKEAYQIHINSVVAEFFNGNIIDMSRLKKNVKQLLKVKYLLKIVDEDPLEFEEIKV